MKFTPHGGKIIITAKKDSTDFAEISVRDSGIGMPKVIIDNLFHIDEHTSRAGTDGEPSTGLGLILCREFVEKHGGKIWADSEDGNGSEFKFTIPLLA